jgi:glycerol-3-phosphate dehydrogenase
MKPRSAAKVSAKEMQFDVCVIGGGATGAGCALDAQLRGLNTILLDAGDFASAASSASTKLVHGGVRYLEQAIKSLNLEEYRMVKNALRERLYMLANAPHLAHPAQFLVPVYSWARAAYYLVGMKLYDAVAAESNLFPSRFLSREATLEVMPGLKAQGLRGAVCYSDGQFDDARYDLALIESFAAAGGIALNYARVTEFARGDAGMLSAATVRDQLSGDPHAGKSHACRKNASEQGSASSLFRRDVLWNGRSAGSPHGRRACDLRGAVARTIAGGNYRR